MACVEIPNGVVDVPDGYSFLKKGTTIKEGDVYFNLDSMKWQPCSDADVGLTVCDVPDIVIRRRKGADASLFTGNEYRPVVTAAML